MALKGADIVSSKKNPFFVLFINFLPFFLSIIYYSRFFLSFFSFDDNRYAKNSCNWLICKWNE